MAIIVTVKLPGQIQQIKNHSMGLQLPNAFFQDVIELNRLAYELRLLRQLQPLHRSIRHLRRAPRHALPACLFEDARHPRVSVLDVEDGDRKSTRLNSSHEWISYAVFCLKKKNNTQL